MPARRQFGNIRRLPSGKYQATFPHPHNPATRVTAPTTYARRSDADQWLRTQQALIETGRWKSPEQLSATTPDPTFDQYAQRYFATCGWTKASARTVRNRYANHIHPHWATRTITTITAPDIEHWITHTLSTLSVTNRRHVYAIFVQIMRAAEGDGTITKAPTNLRYLRALVKNLDKKALRYEEITERRALTLDEVRLIATTVPDYQRPAFHLMAVTGMRTEEVRGLRFKDLDLKNNVIHIRHVVTGSGKNQDAHMGAKTDAGVRDVHLGTGLAATLRDHVNNHSYAPDDYVFQSKMKPGHPLPDNTLRDSMKRVMDRAGLEHATPHSLRHTAITLALRLPGFNEMDVKRYVGHARGADITMRYTHTDEDTQQKLAQAMSDLFYGSGQHNTKS